MDNELSYEDIPCNSLVKSFTLWNLHKVTNLDFSQIFWRLCRDKGITTKSDGLILNKFKELWVLLKKIYFADFTILTSKDVLNQLILGWAHSLLDFMSYLEFGSKPIYYSDLAQNKFRDIFTYNGIKITHETVEIAFGYKYFYNQMQCYSKESLLQAVIDTSIDPFMLNSEFSKKMENWDDNEFLDVIKEVAMYNKRQKYVLKGICLKPNSVYSIRIGNHIGNHTISSSDFKSKIEFIAKIPNLIHFPYIVGAIENDINDLNIIYHTFSTLEPLRDKLITSYYKKLISSYKDKISRISDHFKMYHSYISNDIPHLTECKFMIEWNSPIS